MEDFPETIGPWSRGEIIDYSAPEYDKPDFGCSVKYHLDDDTWATFYFYDAGLTPGVEGFSCEQFLDQMEQSKQQIFDSQLAGAWRSVTHLGDDPLIMNDEICALCSHFEVDTPEGKPLHSMLYLSSTENQFIKLRITFPENHRDDFAEITNELIVWSWSLAPTKCFEIH
jgi:hypothetical protein